MLERVKYAILNFLSCMLFWMFFYYNNNVDISVFVFVCIFCIVLHMDIEFLNGEKYGNVAFICLILNRIISITFILFLSIITNSPYYWMGVIIYIAVFISITISQWDMISDAIFIDELEDNYEHTMDDLKDILSSEQFKTLHTLEKVVDEDKMYLFIATLHPEEIKKLLNIELSGLALLIQKEDYDKITEIAQGIE